MSSLFLHYTKLAGSPQVQDSMESLLEIIRITYTAQERSLTGACCQPRQLPGLWVLFLLTFHADGNTSRMGDRESEEQLTTPDIFGMPASYF